MPVQHRLNAVSAPSSILHPPSSLIRLAIRLCCFLFCLSAFGANEITRTYNYKGFNINGVLLVQGILTLRVDEETEKVKGEWRLQVLDRSKLKDLGPQDGSGKIVGTLKEDRIFLNLNPGTSGDNIYLEGKVTKADIFKIIGKWGRYGFYEGKIIEGPFELTRKNDPPKKTAP